MAGDAFDGEFFGYKVGEKYPLTDTTKGRLTIMGSAEILADHPEKPNEIGEVHIIATPMTFTIANIYSINKFDTKKEAEAFASKYADILDTRYSKGNKIESVLDFQRLILELSNKYSLRIGFHEPDKHRPNYQVHIGLKWCCEKKKESAGLFDKEFDQLVKKGKDKRLKSARKKGLLKGLE